MREFVADAGTGELTHVVDADGVLWQRFGVVAQPAFAFVDDDGTVETFGGSLDPASLRQAADELLVQPVRLRALPAYLGLLVAEAPDGRRAAVVRAVRFAAGIPLGFVAVFGVAGLLAPLALSIERYLPSSRW